MTLLLFASSGGVSFNSPTAPIATAVPIPAAVPEPGTYLLIGSALLLLGTSRKLKLRR